MRSLPGPVRSRRFFVAAVTCFSFYRELWVVRARNWALTVLMMCGMFAVVDSPAAETEATAPQLQEVLVTAQKVTENVQKVPIAMTVISGDTLTQEGVRDFTGVLSEVPNLAFQYGTAGWENMGMSSSRGVAIRGISGSNVRASTSMIHLSRFQSIHTSWILITSKC